MQLESIAIARISVMNQFILNQQANVEIRQQKLEEQWRRTEKQQQHTKKTVEDLAIQISDYVKATEMRLDKHTIGLERLLKFIDEQKEINIKSYESSKRLSQTQIVLAEVQKQSKERQDKFEETQQVLVEVQRQSIERQSKFNERQEPLEDNMENLANAINNLANNLSKNGNSKA